MSLVVSTFDNDVSSFDVAFHQPGRLDFHWKLDFDPTAIGQGVDALWRHQQFAPVPIELDFVLRFGQNGFCQTRIGRGKHRWRSFHLIGQAGLHRTAFEKVLSDIFLARKTSSAARTGKGRTVIVVRFAMAKISI